MGMARWSPADWDSYTSKIAGKSVTDIFGVGLHRDLDPRRIRMRESCDSDLNPLSTPIIVAVVCLVFVGILAEVLVRQGLGTLIEEIYDRKPVTDPHLMLMAVGDAWCDRAPLQVTQFEADLRLAEQLTKFFIEKGGGGNSFESYNLPWYFAATRTKCDALLKRNKKGYLFTVGDEPPPPVLLAKHADAFLDDGLQTDISTRDLLTMASKGWEIFHIMIEEGSHFRREPDQTRSAWTNILGQRAIGLSDHTKLAELIAATIEVNEGADVGSVSSHWNGSTVVTLKKSLALLARPRTASGKGVTRL